MSANTSRRRGAGAVARGDDVVDRTAGEASFISGVAQYTADARTMARDMAARKNQPVPKNFEEALAELEAILSDIEGGEVPLEESLVKYERGTFLIQHCRGVLASAEKQIELLAKAADGSLEGRPLATTSEE